MSGQIPSTSALWTTKEPSERGKAPEWMSFYFFNEAQRCPLSASLRNSYYPSIWARRGYPSRPNAGAVAGIVIHACAGKIIRRFAEAGVNSLMEPAGMSILREAGGFTKMLSETLEDYVNQETSNPRFLQFRDDLLRTLKIKLPDMRATLQELLAAYKWSFESRDGKLGGKQLSDSAKVTSVVRPPVGPGSYQEVELQDASARWTGRVDALVVSAEGCEITDFKTGRPSDEHQKQMWIYAMLWNRDVQRNPRGVPVLKMSLVYTSGPKDIPIPDITAMEMFRAELVEESRGLKLALESDVVPARPSIENCRYCQVKLLCDSYWTKLPTLESSERFSNAELVLIEPRGERSWLAVVKTSKNLSVDERVILRVSENGNAFWKDLRAGLSLRITDTTLSSGHTEDIPLLNLSMLSEALFLT